MHRGRVLILRPKHGDEFTERSHPSVAAAGTVQKSGNIGGELGHRPARPSSTKSGLETSPEKIRSFYKKASPVLSAKSGFQPARIGIVTVVADVVVIAQIDGGSGAWRPANEYRRVLPRRIVQLSVYHSWGLSPRDLHRRVLADICCKPRISWY